MKILLTGGGTGGHFYPLIAVAEAINDIAKQENLVEAKIYFMSNSPYDMEALIENNITFIPIVTGKQRLYSSAENFVDFFKIGLGVVQALFKVFSLYPDIIFSKGGYASFPVLVAARFFRIPVVIHESDSFPGRTNQWSAKFAKKIAISYPETVKFFDKNKTAWTGNPLRKAILSVNKSGAHEYFGFEKQLPTIFVIGGSLGAKIINEAILNALPHLINHYQIIHQTGKNNLAEVNKTAAVILDNNPNHTRYRTFDYLANLPLTMAAGVADLVITRAGSTIFEIASWGLPSIVIPITESNGNHQRLNAYAYSRSGSAEVIEEANLTTNVLVSEVDRLLKDQTILEKMRTNAKNFAKLDAATKIARELINIALSHEE